MLSFPGILLQHNALVSSKQKRTAFIRHSSDATMVVYETGYDMFAPRLQGVVSKELR